MDDASNSLESPGATLEDVLNIQAQLEGQKAELKVHADNVTRMLGVIESLETQMSESLRKVGDRIDLLERCIASKVLSR